jgi:hypothetical protein
MFSPKEENSVKKSALVFTLLAAVLMIAVAGCGDEKETAENAPSTDVAQAQAPAQAANPNLWRGKVVETMNSGGYTYVHLDTGSEKIWAAGPEAEVAVGQEIVMDKGMAMSQFHAKSLERTFEVIYFVGKIMDAAAAETAGETVPHDHPESGAAASPHGAGGGMGMDSGASRNVVEKAAVKDVAKVAGGYTVAEIFAQSATLGGQTVKVRGQVVKFTPNIMGTNWVHIQDGTGSGATADLTVTTSDVVAAGDLVVVEGPLSVNKDFGAGYKYDAIIEGATVTKE